MSTSEKVGGLSCFIHGIGAMVAQCLLLPLNHEQCSELSVGDRQVVVMQVQAMFNQGIQPWYHGRDVPKFGSDRLISGGGILSNVVPIWSRKSGGHQQ